MEHAGDEVQQHRVELFTDGACSGNPGPGGWAYLLRDLGTGKELRSSGGEARTTNNRMELRAVIEGLRALKQPCRVELHADSQYVLKGLGEWLDQWKRRGWKTASKKPVMNEDLWRELDALRGVHALRLTWVEGHAGHAENEEVDSLASAAARAAVPRV